VYASYAENARKYVINPMNPINVTNARKVCKKGNKRRADGGGKWRTT